MALFQIPQPVHQFSGGTILRTDPIPPISQPVFNYYLPFTNRYLNEGPTAQFSGAVSQQTYVFHSLFSWNGIAVADNETATSVQGAEVQATHPIPPLSQPREHDFIRETNRYFLTPTPRLETIIAVVQFTNVFTPYEPLFNYYLLDYNKYVDEVTKRFEGATSQQTSVFFPNQPEMNRFETLKQSPRTIVGVIPRFEGGTILRTDPIPPVSNPLFNYYLPEINRYVDEIVKRFEGAPAVRTDPIPPVSNPLYNYYKPEINRYIDELVKRYEGATSTRTDPIPPVSEPVFNYYKPDINRYQDELVKQLSGAISQQTYIFHSLFSWNGMAVVDNETATSVQGAEVQQTNPIPPVSEPVFNYYTPEINRYVDETIKRLEGLLTVIQTHPVPGVSEPVFNYYKVEVNRYLDEIVKQFTGATSTRTDPIPPVNNPVFNHYLPEINRYVDETIKRYEGATATRTDPIPPVSEPLFNYYKPEINRYIDEAIKRFEGATSTRTDPIPPVSEPVFNHYKVEANRYIDESIKRFEGSTTQQTFPVPPVGNPVFNYYKTEVNRYIDESVKRFEGNLSVRTDPVPPVSNPIFNYYKPEINRYIDELVKQYSGSTIQRTDPIPGQLQPFNYIAYRQAILTNPAVYVSAAAANRARAFGYIIQ